MNATIITLPTHEPAGTGADNLHAEAREGEQGRPLLMWAIDDATGRPAMRWMIPVLVRESSGELAA